MDGNEQCIAWAQDGECNNNAAYMHTVCRKACKMCEPSEGSKDEMQQSD